MTTPGPPGSVEHASRLPRLRSGRVQEADTVSPVASATVLLLREGDDGSAEVFLQERHVESDFAGGAYVFPGGKVDDIDRAMADDLLGPVDATTLQARLGTSTPDEAVALAVAAVREAFEEAGVLLATRGSESVPPSLVASADAQRMRAALADRGSDTDWRPWLRDHDLVLDLGSLVPFAWWVTPHGVHRRYSTRFFVARVPPAQAGTLGHDGSEMTDSVWVRPSTALAAGESGDRVVIYPTRRTLARLAGFDDVDAVMAAARAGAVDLRPIMPVLRHTDDGIGVQHPDGGPVETV